MEFYTILDYVTCSVYRSWAMLDSLFIKMLGFARCSVLVNLQHGGGQMVGGSSKYREFPLDPQLFYSRLVTALGYARCLWFEKLGYIRSSVYWKRLK